MCRSASTTHFRGLPNCNLPSNIGKQLQQKKLPIRASASTGNVKAVSNSNKKTTDKISSKTKSEEVAKPKFRLPPRGSKSPTCHLLFPSSETFRANPSTGDLTLMPSFGRAPPNEEKEDWNMTMMAATPFFMPSSSSEDCFLTPRPQVSSGTTLEMPPPPPMPRSWDVTENNDLAQNFPASTFLPMF
jgi:hypothetical protein